MVAGERAADGTLIARVIETPPLRLLRFLEEGLAAIEQQSASAARSGVRMAIQDTLEMSFGLTQAQVREVDGRLSSAGLPTLSRMRERVWQTLKKVIARGRCRTEAEYYLVVERLADMSDESLCEEDRRTLVRIVVDFEDRHGSPEQALPEETSAASLV